MAPETQALKQLSPKKKNPENLEVIAQLTESKICWKEFTRKPKSRVAKRR